MIDKKLIELVEILKMTYACDEMQHGWRFNGVIDIYKYGSNVYNKKENTHKKIFDLKELEIYVVTILAKYPPEGKYEVKNEKKPTYQEFKKKVLKFSDQSLSSQKAEDYHWELTIGEKGEDDLYFLFHDNFVKIGRTKDMQKRIKQLKTSLHSEYECFILKKKGFLERKFHHIFSEFKSRGEWFRFEPRMKLFIEKRLRDKTAYKFKEMSKKSKL